MKQLYALYVLLRSYGFRLVCHIGETWLWYCPQQLTSPLIISSQYEKPPAWYMHLNQIWYKRKFWVISIERYDIPFIKRKLYMEILTAKMTELLILKENYGLRSSRSRTSFRWLSVRLRYLQCISDGVLRPCTKPSIYWYKNTPQPMNLIRPVTIIITTPIWKQIFWWFSCTDVLTSCLCLRPTQALFFVFICKFQSFHQRCNPSARLI